MFKKCHASDTLDTKCVNAIKAKLQPLEVNGKWMCEHALMSQQDLEKLVHAFIFIRLYNYCICAIFFYRSPEHIDHTTSVD